MEFYIQLFFIHPRFNMIQINYILEINLIPLYFHMYMFKNN